MNATSPAPARTTAHRPPRARKRPWVAGAVALLLVYLVLRPPFVVRPLPGRVAPGATPGAATPTEEPAAAFVNPIWTAKVLPTIEAKAVDVVKLLPAIRADPEAAGQQYGQHESTNPYNYLVKGTGKVAAVNTQSQAGTVTLEVPGLEEKVVLQIGPVVRGTALRDATGLVSFNQFANQLEYADVAKEMNARALRTALTSPPAVGDTVAFLGAFTFDPRAKGPVLITPVKVTSTPAAPPTPANP